MSDKKDGTKKDSKKSEKVINVRGERVRELRRQRGMSQSVLAKGICTQATISLIEKKNKVPSLNTLVKIARRLDVALEDIVQGDSITTQHKLSQIEEYLKQRNYDAAFSILSQNDPEQIKDLEARRQFGYLYGLGELLGHADYDEAIYYFNRVLAPAQQGPHNSLTVLATIGLALAYARQGKLDRARIYLREARNFVDELTFTKPRQLDVQLTMRLQGGQCALLLGNPEEALHDAESGIAQAVGQGRLYLLDELYDLRAQCLQKLGSDPSTDEENARVLARIINLAAHTVVLEANAEVPAAAEEAVSESKNVASAQ
jgi:transcriptional regulator with XRE-family HTH domain